MPLRAIQFVRKALTNSRTPASKEQDPGLLKRLEEMEISEWLDWMRRELPSGGAELPSEETSVLFAANAVHIADQVQAFGARLDPNLNRTLIQASLLHQCWTRQRAMLKDVECSIVTAGKLQTCHSIEFLRKLGEDTLMRAADGRLYRVKFPQPERDTALATEIICLELARLMGLPVPRAAVILVNRKLAQEAGVTAKAPLHKNGLFPCLGLLTINNMKENDGNWPEARPGGKEFLYRTGMLVFNVLVLHPMLESDILRVGGGLVKPIFLYRSHCMLEANWPRYVRATYKDQVGLPPLLVHRVRDIEELQVWVRKARNIDLNRLWELAFALPGSWYGGHRIALANVLKKIEKRIIDLPESVQYLARQGYFPNINRGAALDLRESWDKIA
jgi:hypothetical protein